MESHSVAILNSLLEKFRADMGGNCKLLVFNGAVPANSWSATAATLVMEMTGDGIGDGLEFAAAEQGYLAKDPNQVWEGTPTTTAPGTFYRIVPLSDDGVSAVAPESVMRSQGTIGIVNSNWNTSVVFQSGVPFQLENFFLTLPVMS